VRRRDEPRHIQVLEGDFSTPRLEVTGRIHDLFSACRCEHDLWTGEVEDENHRKNCYDSESRQTDHTDLSPPAPRPFPFLDVVVTRRQRTPQIPFFIMEPNGNLFLITTTTFFSMIEASTDEMLNYSNLPLAFILQIISRICLTFSEI